MVNTVGVMNHSPNASAGLRGYGVITLPLYMYITVLKCDFNVAIT